MIPFHDFKTLQNPRWFREYVYEGVCREYEIRRHLMKPRMIDDVIILGGVGKLGVFKKGKTSNGFSYSYLGNTHTPMLDVTTDKVSLFVKDYGWVDIHENGGVQFQDPVYTLYENTGVVFTRSYATGMVSWDGKEQGILPPFLKKIRSENISPKNTYTDLLISSSIPFMTTDDDIYVLD